jgi:glycosyltransferase involved in cell wall biosynthesis
VALTTNKTYISVIVPSYNQEKHVGNLLNSLKNQVTEHNFKVILVDSGTDNTAKIVKKEFPWVQLIELNKRAHPGKGRNIGIDSATSDIIAFTDCDCVVCPNWVNTIIESLSRDQIITGPVYNGTPKNLWGTVDYLLEFYDFWDFEIDKKFGPVGSCNLAFSLSLYKTFGPLDENIKGSDARFTRKVLNDLGYISWVPDLTIHHNNRTKFTKILKNQLELGKGAVVSSAKVHKLGAILLKYPVLIPFIPIVRSIRIGRILARKTFSNFVKFLILYPFVLIGLSAYAFGFGFAIKSLKMEGNSN